VLKVASEIGATVTADLALDDVLSKVAEHVGRAFRASECDIYEYRAQDDTVIAAGLWARRPSPADDAWLGTEFTLDRPRSFVHAIRERRIWERSVADADLPAYNRGMMERWGEKSVLCVPLIAGDEVIGALSLIEKDGERRFSLDERSLLTMLAVPAAVAIQHVRLRRAWRDQDLRLQSLLATSRAMSSMLQVRPLLGTIAQVANDALGADECSIDIYDEASETLTVAAYHRGWTTEAADEYVGRVYPLSRYAADRAHLFGRLVVEERVSDPAIDPVNRASMEANGEKTVLSVPLWFEERPIGILAFFAVERERHFGDDEVELARALGEQAAAAIYRAQLLERSEAQNHRLNLLLESTRAITSSVDLEEVLDIVARTTCEALDCEQCQIQSYDAAARSITVSGHYQRHPDPAALESYGKTFSLEDEPDELEMLERKLTVEQQASDLELPAGTRESMQAFGDKTYLNVPLVFNDEPIGLLVLVERDRERHFSAEEIALAQALGEQAASAIEHARLYKAVQEQAITDGLTGLFNHRYFYERLDQEIARAHRYGGPVSLLMIDIDDFKRFNDRHGHVMGDEMLRRVADLLSRQLREVDLAARYGGEEFAVVLPNTGVEPEGAAPQQAQPGEVGPPAFRGGHRDGARAVAERIRHEIETAHLMPDGRSAHLTVSIGIAAFPQLPDVQDLVRYADGALYTAKRRGKNRVEVFVRDDD
jgi:GAF domain-containing protein